MEFKSWLAKFLFKRGIEKAVLKEVTQMWYEYTQQFLREKGLPFKKVYSEIEEKMEQVGFLKRLSFTAFREIRKMIGEYSKDFFAGQ